MALLIDLFGYLSIIIHGFTIPRSRWLSAACCSLPCWFARSRRGLAWWESIERGCLRITAWSAVALVACEAATIALQTAVLVGTVDLIDSGCAAGGFCRRRNGEDRGGGADCGYAVHTAATCPGLRAARAGRDRTGCRDPSTHAAARLDYRTPLLLVEFLHQLGAAIWIGGIPCFLIALGRIQNAQAWRLVGSRFSRMSMAGVACILLSGITMSLLYIGDWQGFYGTAYGVMVGAKIAMFLMLLGLGAGNFLLVERLRAHPETPIIRLKRFAEVEIGIGVAIFFAAASLTSVPPAVDLTQDRVSWPEIAERNTPEWPRFASPDHDKLALPALQAKLDAEAAHHRATPQVAFVPGSGELPPRNAADIAWSEYNHHWSGLFVLAIGVLSLLNQAGLRWARHWPLLFLGLAAFLFVRSDPEVWPLGEIGFFASFRDIEVLQHRMFVLLIAAFGVFEWRVRTSRDVKPWARLVFPLLCAGGGVLLLTHSHAIANLKEQLLIELTHTPLALTGIVAGWARWLELRLDPVKNRGTQRFAGWVWPICFILVGLMLLSYREA